MLSQSHYLSHCLKRCVDYSGALYGSTSGEDSAKPGSPSRKRVSANIQHHRYASEARLCSLFKFSLNLWGFLNPGHVFSQHDDGWFYAVRQ